MDLNDILKDKGIPLFFPVSWEQHGTLYTTMFNPDHL